MVHSADLGCPGRTYDLRSAAKPGANLLAEATRRKVYDMLSTENMIVQGFHYPFPAHAYVERTATGYREVPVNWSATLS